MHVQKAESQAREHVRVTRSGSLWRSTPRQPGFLFVGYSDDPDADEDLLNRAYVYAMKAHGNQKRASGEAYFNHPLEVAAILTEMKLDSATIAAALLHDTVEDTEATHQEI